MRNPSNQKIFTVLLSNEEGHDINHCLGKIFSSNTNNMEVVVIGMDPKSESLELAKKKFKKCHYLIASDKNCVQTLNLAVRFCLEKMADYILITDTKIFLKPQTIEYLRENINQNCEMIVPLIQDKATKEILNYPLELDWKKMTFLKKIDLKKDQNLITVDFVYPLPIMLHKKIFKKVGLFDDKFNLLWSFYDFFHKIKNQNHAVCLAPKTVVFSDRSSLDTSQDDFSRDLFFKRHSNFYHKTLQRFHYLYKLLKK